MQSTKACLGFKVKGLNSYEKSSLSFPKTYFSLLEKYGKNIKSLFMTRSVPLFMMPSQEGVVNAHKYQIGYLQEMICLILLYKANNTKKESGDFLAKKPLRNAILAYERRKTFENFDRQVQVIEGAIYQNGRSTLEIVLSQVLWGFHLNHLQTL